MTSLDINSGELRLIEVKGLADATGTILLTPNERRVAEDRRDCYWLYVVTNCAAQPTLQEPVKDPARFPWHEVTKVGRFERGRIERIDEPLFPVAALCEALVNALCHRDYSITGGCVSAAIFDDRLEIWSDGTLPFGLKPEDLKRNHRSLPRNPFIVNAFYLRGLVEEWGRGTQMIVDLCVRAGHPEPEFVAEGNAFGVRFLPSGYIAPHRVAHDLTERQREILQILSRHREAPLRWIREGLAHPAADRTIQEDLAHLRRLGLVDASGRGRGAWYWLRRDSE